jgi:DNA-directed RNA polymerase subunit L
MITDVETVAFASDITENGSTSDILITKNSTPMSNEMLAHRIGLLPIHIVKPLEWVPTQYTFKLDITNDSTEARDVVAADIQVLKNRGPEEDPLPVPSVQFFHPDPVTHDTALLTVLKGKVGLHEPESLSFTATAKVGTGRQNARYMPVTSRCSYGYTLDDSAERKKEMFTKWLTTHKKVSTTELESNSTRKGELEREFATMEVQRCYKIDARGEPYSFDFIIESVGVLDPTYTVARALDVLQKKLLKYASIDSGDLPEGLKITPADARMKGFDFMFQNEDHTLGNLLQTWMEENLVDSGEITFVGYKVPHPLRDEMLLRVGVESGLDTAARVAVAKAARECAQMFKNWSGQWAGVANV